MLRRSRELCYRDQRVWCGGLVTPLDVLEAIAGEFPDADETPEIITDGDGWR